MTKSDAVWTLFYEGSRSNTGITGYRRLRTAFRALGLTEGEQEDAFYSFGYYGEDRKPHAWLAAKLAKKAPAKQTLDTPQQQHYHARQD